MKQVICHGIMKMAFCGLMVVGASGCEDEAIADLGSRFGLADMNQQAVAAYTFDDCTPGTQIGMALDVSGNGLNAWGQPGAMCEEGPFGGAVRFSGNGMLTIPNVPAVQFSTAFTLSAWVNPDKIWGLNTIIGKWYGPDSYLLLIENGHFRLMIQQPGTPWVVLDAPATAGVWTHVAATFDGHTATLFVDGVMQISRPAVGPLQGSWRPVTIGSHPSWNQYSGLMDNIALFNTALSPQQIAVIADIVPPTISMSISATQYTVDEIITITCSASDALSGVIGGNCENLNLAAWELGAGVHTISMDAVDAADNIATAAVTFEIIVNAVALETLLDHLDIDPLVASTIVTFASGIENAPNDNAKTNRLNAFANYVNARTGKNLTTEEAALLISLAGSL